MSQIIYFIENSGYYKYVIAAGEGDSDVFFPLGFKNHYIEKLFKLHLAWPINKRSDAPYVKIWFNSILKGINIDPKQDLYILLAESYHLSYSNNFLNYLKSKYPDAKLIFCFSNPAGDYNLKKLQKVILNYDAVLTFHKKDAELYGYFYCDDMPYRLPNIDQDDLDNSDVFFVGANKGRLRLLLSIYDKLSNAGLKCDFFICGVEKKDQIFREGIVYNKRISYDEVLKHVKASKCVLEVLQNGNNYVSIRTNEAIQYNKKLLTTNSEIINTSFYNKELVQIFSGDNIDTNFFVKEVASDVYNNINSSRSFLAMKEYLKTNFKRK